jgi:hypothetical protein
VPAPALQDVPFATLVKPHPVAGAQRSVVHSLLSLQVTPTLPTQDTETRPSRPVEVRQSSVPLQTLPSEQLTAALS